VFNQIIQRLVSKEVGELLGDGCERFYEGRRDVGIEQIADMARIPRCYGDVLIRIDDRGRMGKDIE